MFWIYFIHVEKPYEQIDHYMDHLIVTTYLNNERKLTGSIFDLIWK